MNISHTNHTFSINVSYTVYTCKIYILETFIHACVNVCYVVVSQIHTSPNYTIVFYTTSILKHQLSSSNIFKKIMHYYLYILFIIYLILCYRKEIAYSKPQQRTGKNTVYTACPLLPIVVNYLNQDLAYQTS